MKKTTLKDLINKKLKKLLSEWRKKPLSADFEKDKSLNDLWSIVLNDTEYGERS